MNTLDKQYTDLLQDILDNGVTKGDRTGTGTLSVFGRQIRHKMSDGFPLLTTKKMPFKTIVTELLWFLRGDTNIKYLVDNDCHIWDGDAYKNYTNYPLATIQDHHTNLLYQNRDKGWCRLNGRSIVSPHPTRHLTQEEFINKIKTDDGFAKKWGELGPIYGRMWRMFDEDTYEGIDQIANLINDLKTNPDSRRLLVTAWHPGYNQHSVLPPCHYGFQVYTRELIDDERARLMDKIYGIKKPEDRLMPWLRKDIDDANIPTRAISLMWNQRSVDTFLGLPFNIASYGLLLEIIAKAVNMVPDELIGNLGDTHLYSNHVEQAKEQIGRERTHEEMVEMYYAIENKKDREEYWTWETRFDDNNISKHTRNPYPLPTLNINTEFWPYEGGECGVGPLDAVKVFESFKDNNFCKCLLEEDIQLSNYQSHPTIKAPLSN
jgi:thymidylate synthase